MSKTSRKTLTKSSHETKRYILQTRNPEIFVTSPRPGGYIPQLAASAAALSVHSISKVGDHDPECKCRADICREALDKAVSTLKAGPKPTSQAGTSTGEMKARESAGKIVTTVEPKKEEAIKKAAKKATFTTPTVSRAHRITRIAEGSQLIAPKTGVRRRLFTTTIEEEEGDKMMDSTITDSYLDKQAEMDEEFGDLEDMAGVDEALREQAEVNLLATTVSTVMLMASGQGVPQIYIDTALAYLRCIHLDNGNVPPNVQGILNKLAALNKGSYIPTFNPAATSTPTIIADKQNMEDKPITPTEPIAASTPIDEEELQPAPPAAREPTADENDV